MLPELPEECEELHQRCWSLRFRQQMSGELTPEQRNPGISIDRENPDIILILLINMGCFHLVRPRYSLIFSGIRNRAFSFRTGIAPPLDGGYPFLLSRF